jgi:hypothetical protein
MPLGPDPIFITYNFQITADLTKDSDPALCTEGQEAKGSVGFTGHTQVKMACSAGKTLSVCKKNSDCDFPAVPGLGVCSPYPDNGPSSQRGNDDYTSPFDLGPKQYLPPSQIVWIDDPGASALARQAAVAADPHGLDYSEAIDFLAFVKGNALTGGNSCSCHFTVNLSWLYATGSYFLPGTFINLVNDAETQNCVIK